MVVRAHVKNGRFIVDDPANLPEGTVVELIVVEEPFDAMAPDERAALLAQVDRSVASIRAGEPGIDGDDLLREVTGR